MKRRVALKQVMLAAVAAALVPSCTFDGKKLSVQLSHLKVDGDQEALLALIVDTIVPTTDIPGASSLGVHLFVLKMIDDCYDKKTQEDFVAGLGQMSAVAKQQLQRSFAKCTSLEQEAVLRSIEKNEGSIPKELHDSFPLIKRFTIQ